MKKSLQVVFWAIVAAVCLSGCVAVDPYGRPVIVDPFVPVYAYPAYPAGVYPYFWNGLYYYPFYENRVWAYREYVHPVPNWTGPSLRHHGPAPRYWKGGGHHQPPPRFGYRPAPVPDMRRAAPPSRPQYSRPQSRPMSLIGGGRNR